MFLLLRSGCTQDERENLLRGLEEIGIPVQVSEGRHRTVIGIEGNEDRLRDMALDRFPGVEKVVPLASGAGV